MDRKNFFIKACQFGVCSCAGMSLLAGTSAFAASTKPEMNDEPDWRVGFMQFRFSKLIEMLNSSVDKPTRIKILENMGRACSNKAAENYKKYIGDIDGFLKNLEESWAEKASYDKEKKEIKIVGKKTENCFCPFVDKSKMTDEFCNCSLGWQKETIKNIIGKEVTAHIDSSILKGGTSCNFTINVL